MTRDDDGAEAFIDAALQYESTWERAEDHERLHGPGLTYYGASMGVVRGTIRDARRRYPDLRHDDITALASALWKRPVLERRMAAIVLLQSSVPLLRASDLTRVEGFLRTADVQELVDPLAVDVVGPLLLGLTAPESGRVRGVVERWATDDDVWLRRAAVLVHLPALRAGAGEDEWFQRTVRLVQDHQRGSAVDVADEERPASWTGVQGPVEDALVRVRAVGAS